MTLRETIDRTTVADLRARGSFKWTAPGPDGFGAAVAEMDFGAAPPVLEALRDAVRARAVRLPAAEAGRRAGRRVRGLRRRPLRLGRRPGRRPPRRRRAQRARVRDHPVLAAGLAGDPADAGVHAVPRRAALPRPRRAAGADARGRRPLHLRSRRDRRRLPRRRPPAGAVQPVQPARPGVHRGRAARGHRGRRPPRRPGVRRRDPRPARLPRPPPRALRLDLGHRRRPRDHSGVGVEGVEPARAQVRRGDPVQRRRPRRVGRARPVPRQRRERRRRRRVRRRLPRRARLAGRGGRLPRRVTGT